MLFVTRRVSGRVAWLGNDLSGRRGVARFLAGRGEVVLEISRTPRAERRSRGKANAADDLIKS